MTTTQKKTVVVALGGNAITRKGVTDTIGNQFKHTRESLSALVPFIRAGYGLAVTHGNGPQVGNAILRVELAASKAPILPLGICVADTEGGMGYMIQQSLQNRLLLENVDAPVVTVITQVVVDGADPEIRDPSKFIGQWYTRDEAKRFKRERGWAVKVDGKKGWRRVVPSPRPLKIVEAETIKSMIAAGSVVIACGGGGVPVTIELDGTYEGLDAVIDKDRASAVLAREIGAETLIILTDVERVAVNFGRIDQQLLDRVTVDELQRYFDEGHFPKGSMGPKIEAAIDFIRGGGREVIITAIEQAEKVVSGECGTHVVGG